MRSSIFVVLAALTLATPTPSAAQFRMNQQGSRRPVSVAIGGGASVPIGSYKDALKAGWNTQGSLIFNLPGFPLALRADLNYHKFTFKENLPLIPGGGTGGPITTTGDITQQILGGLANISIPLGLGGPITPYVTAGLAAFNIKTSFGDAVPGAEDESATKFAVDGGVGLSLRLFGASAFLEAKVANVYTDKGFISNKELKSLQFVPVTFGFVF